MNRAAFVGACAATVAVRPAIAGAGAKPSFAFYNDFKLNLHHTLYRQAGLVQYADRAGVALLHEPARRMYDEALSLRGSDRETWFRALAFYEAQYDGRSLIFDDGMVSLDNGLASGTVPNDLASVLDAVAPVYRRTLWRSHAASNERRIAALRANLAAYGAPLFARLSDLLETPWNHVPYRVDVVANTDRDGAYSNAAKRFWHIFLSSYDRENDGLDGFEILAHEAAHSIVDPRFGRGARWPCLRFGICCSRTVYGHISTVLCRTRSAHEAVSRRYGHARCGNLCNRARDSKRRRHRMTIGFARTVGLKTIGGASR